MIRTLMLTPLLAGAIAATATAKNNDSLKNEAAQAIRRGVRFLEARQDGATGAVGDLENAGITALSVLAILGDPAREPKLLPASAHKGYDFIATTKRPDGGLYVKGLADYNTSLCLTALMAHPTGDLRPLARAARTSSSVSSKIPGNRARSTSRTMEASATVARRNTQISRTHTSPWKRFTMPRRSMPNARPRRMSRS